MSDEVTAEENDLTEKSHTFRKRRLTLSSRYIDSPPFKTTSDDEATERVDIVCNTSSPSTSYHDNGNKKSFRKRRLTLTKNDKDDFDSLDNEPNVVDSLPTRLPFDDNNLEPCRKKRRMSEISNTSKHSRSTLGSKIHHAGEIIRHPSSASAAKTENRLYAPPFNIEREETEEEKKSQPLWKRRMTRHYLEDETKLPFPRHIVGQYSCHGTEPAYDSDFDNDSDEKDDTGESDLNMETSPDKINVNEDLNRVKEEKCELTHIPEIPPIKFTTSAKINQDRGGIAFPYANCDKTALFAVYDGHGQGGELVSQFALHHIQRKLKKHPNFLSDIEKAFKDTFLEVDEELKEEPTVEALYAGTTACVALLREKKLIVSNAGDSRAVLARQKKGNYWETIELSEDQNPDSPEEQARIEKCGGFVSPPPEPGLSARVWLDSGCTQIGLAMSRSIGDHAIKDVGVVAEPVVTFHNIDPEDEFLILASDGVWEFISSEEAVEIVRKNISKGSSLACQFLIEAAAERWHEEEGDYRDDITALVVQVQKALEYLQSS
mmetsp:Transcript_30772/g.35094  ORF Transcript_30772/g.35094 Transcript_30772/m.35094 type:complete len:547 (-) Transcript_30772:346-1986(-)|eukprot:CAMPEP_0194151310 /NCGR_PEP_ID=MMETSP0152-20130528/47579_1 /TAXON_ID=1049557 /ORGANISM="Thalassiothrix antarctica, Strain L6-D1" /LENGTH=546 /DNA_ID=CAMNT_0038855009 /DNA_START=25 /DNA_END=1665 /DNA_ORIENTATION=-